MSERCQSCQGALSSAYDKERGVHHRCETPRADTTDRRIAERRKRDEGCSCMRYGAARISSWCRATTRRPDSDRRKAPQPPPKPEDETTAFPRAAAPGSLALDAAAPKPPPKAVPPTNDETMRRIVERVARDAIGLAIMRQMLILEDSGEAPTDEEEAEIVADVINCLTGDDIGCGDEEDANNPDKCAGAFVRNILGGGTQ